MTITTAASRQPRRRSPRDESGVALIIALLAIVLMTALGMALMLNSQTETMISANYRDATEAEYAADAGIERVMLQDFLPLDFEMIDLMAEALIGKV